MPFYAQPPVNQFGAPGGFYDSIITSPLGGAQPSKQIFMRDRRRRMNALAMIVCVIVPSALFAAMYAVTSFEMHYKQAEVTILIVVLGFLLAASVAGYAALTRTKWLNGGGVAEREPTWLIFLALAMFLAWVLGVVLGSQNYKANMRPYYDLSSLNEYVNVSVTTARGQQLMDAGIIDFAQGTQLDVSKSMGFKSDTVYCVAPITMGKKPLATYDFWAVGTGCCTGPRPDFHCGGWNASSGHGGGLRLMSDGDRAYYRLAVQQAEAAHKILASHPLFFEWVEDAHGRVDSWQRKGVRDCGIFIAAYFILQFLLVSVAYLLFSKLGQR